MSRFIEGQDRQQVTLLPECLDDFIGEDNPVRVVDAFVAELNLVELGFDRTVPARTGRPAYDPAVLLKVYIYGYLNRVQSSRRLEHECQRNVEVMWLTGRLAPDFKTIADFRRDNGTGIRNVCRRFVVLCRDLKLFAQGAVAIDGSKFKAVNSRDRNFTPAKVDKRKEQIEESIQRYMSALDTADRTLPLLEFGPRYAHLTDKIKTLREQMRRMDQMKERLKAEPGEQLSVPAQGERDVHGPQLQSVAVGGMQSNPLCRKGLGRRQALFLCPALGTGMCTDGHGVPIRAQSDSNDLRTAPALGTALPANQRQFGRQNLSWLWRSRRGR